MRQDQLGVVKIGWELERISTKEDVGIGMEISCREIWDWKIWYQESMRARMKKGCFIGSQSNWEDWAKEQMFFGNFWETLYWKRISKILGFSIKIQIG